MSKGHYFIYRDFVSGIETTTLAQSRYKRIEKKIKLFLTN